MEKLEALSKLAELKDRGISVTSQIVEISTSKEVPESVERFIESHNQTESKRFFENLRKMSNEKNHKLYKNILDESLTEIETLKCLSSYMTTAVIQMESYEDPQKCVELRKSVGLEKVSEALADYYNGRDYNKINEAIDYLRSIVRE